jgi:hypothetical protein
MFVDLSVFVAVESVVVFGFRKFVDVVLEPACFGDYSTDKF